MPVDRYTPPPDEVAVLAATVELATVSVPEEQ